jgi:hypothetical protein
MEFIRHPKPWGEGEFLVDRATLSKYIREVNEFLRKSHEFLASIGRVVIGQNESSGSRKARPAAWDADLVPVSKTAIFYPHMVVIGETRKRACFFIAEPASLT